MSVGPLRSVLDRLGLDATPREIAEILWLATRLPAPSSAAAHVPEAHSPQPSAEKEGREGNAAPVSPGERAVSEPVPAIPIHAPAPIPSEAPRLSAVSVRLAADPPLPRRLELLRALRPLKRRVPSARVGEFDEEATVESMALRSGPGRRGALVPVLRPAPERWLDVVLVLDGHPTGRLLWTPLGREVHRMLVQLGAFRDVRLRYLHTRPDGSPGLSVHPTPHPDRIRDTSEILDPSGRRLVLVLTDGVAPGWQNAFVQEAVVRWASAGPLAFLQTLPEVLWRRTALPAVPARLTRAPLSAANTDLAYRGRRRGSRELPRDSVPVPVLELSPQWLSPWAHLVAGIGSPTIDMAVTLVTAAVQRPQAAADDRPPIRRLEDFRATASPDAFRLLACLSAVPLTVTIMRVVQAAMLPGTAPTVLAEVLFSGLISAAVTDDSTPPADVPHDFLPGVRAALLESLRAHEVDRILHEVSRYVESGAAAAGRVSGLVPAPVSDSEPTAGGDPWALLREEALARAGLTTPSARVPTQAVDDAYRVVHGRSGPFQLTVLITIADFSDVYLGIDADGRQAVVKVQPHDVDLQPKVFQALAYVEAEALRRMDARYAPPLIDVDRQIPLTWLAMGYVTSISGLPASNLLNGRWYQNGPSDDFNALCQLARRLAEALDRAHSAGIVHGNLSPHAVLIVPDTVVLISWVYAQFDGRPHAYAQYRGRASGYLPPEGYPLDVPLHPSFDIYGLGAILLHEATRGRGSARSHRSQSLLPSHLGSLRTLIGRCLDPDPQLRPTARQLLDELRELTPPREAAPDRGAEGDDIWRQLESMAGPDGLKQFLADLRARTTQDRELRTLGFPAAAGTTPPRLVFTGHRGTGKSTAARLVGEACRDLGLLTRGHLVEVRMEDLVADHVGRTAALVDQVVDQALDGVLLIDGVPQPAYLPGASVDEAIHTLLGRMESDRRRLVVILAGPPRTTREFLTANPGLTRRFPAQSVFEFPHLAPDTLMAILERRLEGRGLRLAEDTADRLRRIVVELHRRRDESFGNAQDMHALADAVADRWTRRRGLAAEELVTVEDIPEPYRALLARPVLPPSGLLGELDDLVGLGTVRDVLEGVAGRLREGLTRNAVAPPNLLFTGPPGTGKSTVARIMGRLFNDLGALRRGHCVEVSCADLVGSHLGQTGPLVRGAVQDALDGVLFLRDADRLGRHADGFGREALDALIDGMEHSRGRVVVIAAGSQWEMDAFLAAAPGLSSRFAVRVGFPQYDTADLVEILRRRAAARGYTLGPGVPARVAEWLRADRVVNPAGFDNVRAVRRLLDRMEGRLADRHRHAPSFTAPPTAFLPADVA
ncbi:SAV_2336 N-terminal domain-related protein [Streptomyces sp. NPDC048179]|uniref:SAV_2336 N-terminal domain-related protein n=1 Tax=Streptomyces sp. NPDC048179 TaxID=3365506 RepID=UPI003723A690